MVSTNMKLGLVTPFRDESLGSLLTFFDTTLVRRGFNFVGGDGKCVGDHCFPVIFGWNRVVAV